MAVWNSYSGWDAFVLAAALFAIGFLLIFYATRLKRAMKIPSVGGARAVVIVVCWILCLVFLLEAFFNIPILIRVLLRLTPQNAAQLANILSAPISTITILSAIFTFIAISYLCRAGRLRVALVNAFIGTAAAPMIFELPYLLIVMGTVKLTASVMVHFYLPLLLATISTLTLLLISGVPKVSSYVLFSLGGMFIVLAVWAFFGFSYPSDPLPFTLNGLSKVLGFTTAVMLFLKPNLN